MTTLASWPGRAYKPFRTGPVNSLMIFGILAAASAALVYALTGVVLRVLARSTLARVGHRRVEYDGRW